ncbi:hypothetical protein Hanom_Chr11g00986661 [Helianthus anomalus]
MTKSSLFWWKNLIATRQPDMKLRQVLFAHITFNLGNIFRRIDTMSIMIDFYYLQGLKKQDTNPPIRFIFHTCAKKKQLLVPSSCNRFQVLSTVPNLLPVAMELESDQDKSSEIPNHSSIKQNSDVNSREKNC